jgi:hypothetical protein
MTSPRHPLALWAAAGGLGIFLAGLFAVWHPASDPASSWCLYYRVSGMPCPGCGMTRALAALFHGEWREVLRLHPWAPAVVAQVAGAWLLWGVALAKRGLALPRWLRFEFVGLANVAVLCALWVGRIVTGTLPW